jgi:diguanylate cyclase (GGDEF)-like protein
MNNETYSEGKTSATLLYVEDDKDSRCLVTGMIHRLFPDITVIVAEDGKKGLDLYIANQPDIVLTDIIMPRMDGIRMAREIRKINGTARIIVLTASNDTAFILDAVDIGISRYVQKPIRKSDLVSAIGLCLENVRQTRQLHRQEEYIRQLAYYDSLTGLPNRELLNELLHQGLAQAHRNNRFLAVMFLDLDRFKVINDTMGHAVGDQVLQAMAQRLKHCCRRQQDTVSRRGGDEFIILLPDLGDPREAARFAQKIIAASSQPLILPGHELFISTCIGISIYPDDGTDGDTLIENADKAMYSAKEAGRNRYHLFNPSIDALSFRLLTMENSLRSALDKDELFLHYQPVINVETGTVVSIEAVARWRHPELGLVPPEQFIPLAEEVGLIEILGERILHAACRQIKAWQETNCPPVRLAINFSPRQFENSKLGELVESILAETDTNPRCLELEVTEAIMLLDPEPVSVVLRHLSDLGVHISIDSFGTRLSSLSLLNKFPIHTLKIDKSFVHDLVTNSDNARISRAVVLVASTLGLRVVAEGVETREEMEYLFSLDCREMQGFFFSKPLSAEEILPLLTNPAWAASWQLERATR